MSRDQYPLDKVFQVAREFVRGKTMKAAAESAGVEYNAVKQWNHRQSIDWVDSLKAARREYWDDNLSRKVNIHEETMEALKDRVINGDYVRNQRTGEISRIPMKGADLTKAIAVLSKQATDPPPQTQKMKSMEDMARELEEHGNGKGETEESRPN